MSPKSESGSSTLVELSSQLAAAIEIAGNSVVAIHARRRIPSSGIVWRDGVIVSASHTVRRDDEMPVTLPNGDSTVATVAGRDPATDLIALRIKGAKSHVAPRADSSSLRVGSLVLAVGRPGRNVSASFGIISAVGEGWRSWQGARIDRVFRLDLSVYDGFSGGPLVDASGAVLGLNNSALARGTPMALPAKAVDRESNTCAIPISWRNWRFSGLPAVANTSAPNQRATATAARPVPPAAAWINTRSPRRRRPT